MTTDHTPHATALAALDEALDALHKVEPSTAEGRELVQVAILHTALALSKAISATEKDE